MFASPNICHYLSRDTSFAPTVWNLLATVPVWIAISLRCQITLCLRCGPRSRSEEMWHCFLIFWFLLDVHSLLQTAHCVHPPSSINGDGCWRQWANDRGTSTHAQGHGLDYHWWSMYHVMIFARDRICWLIFLSLFISSGFVTNYVNPTTTLPLLLQWIERWLAGNATCCTQHWSFSFVCTIGFRLRTILGREQNLHLHIGEGFALEWVINRTWVQLWGI